MEGRYVEQYQYAASNIGKDVGTWKRKLILLSMGHVRAEMRLGSGSSSIGQGAGSCVGGDCAHGSDQLSERGSDTETILQGLHREIERAFMIITRPRCLE
ncbi:MAG: hypothetical protein QW290_10085 [Sulfolobales archaeon]